MAFPGIKFSFWMQAGNMLAMVRTLNRWYRYVCDVALWPVQQFDIDTAALFVVDMLAWERDVQRFNQEPEWLYRQRVKFAYINARDAGTVAGFRRIWERMGLGYMELEERLDGRDWDIVRLTVTESTLVEQPELLNIIIEKYGRTCRRYEWTTIVNTGVNIRTAHIEHGSEYVCARLEIN